MTSRILAIATLSAGIVFFVAIVFTNSEENNTGNAISFYISPANLTELWKFTVNKTGVREARIYELKVAVENNTYKYVSFAFGDDESYLVNYDSGKTYIERYFAGKVKTSIDPLNLLSSLEMIINSSNANANITVKPQHGKTIYTDDSDIYAIRDTEFIPLGMVEFPSDYTATPIVVEYNLSEVEKRQEIYFLWEDLINASVAEPVFTVLVVGLDGEPEENVRVTLNLGNSKRLLAKTDENGLAIFRDKVLLEVFESPVVVKAEKENLVKSRVVFRDWKAKIVFSTRIFHPEQVFELKLEADRYVARLGEDVTFVALLTYKGEVNTEIYFAHLHPIRIEIRNETGIVARLPEVLCDVITSKIVGPNSCFSESLNYRFEREGVYKVVAYAEISAFKTLNESVRVYSNPVVMKVV